MIHLVIGLVYLLGLLAEVRGVLIASGVALRRIRYVRSSDIAVAADIAAATAESPTPHIVIGTTDPYTQKQIDQLRERIDALEAGNRTMRAQVEHELAAPRAELESARRAAADLRERDEKQAKRAVRYLIAGPILAFAASAVWLAGG
jgi:uncharacterized protein YgbK (DUF1537 family)